MQLYHVIANVVRRTELKTSGYCKITPAAPLQSRSSSQMNVSMRFTGNANALLPPLHTYSYLFQGCHAHLGV